MKLRNKKTSEIIYAIFEQCEGNIKVINKDEPMKWGEYSSLKLLNEEWEDYEEPKEIYFISSQATVEHCPYREWEKWDKEKSIGNYFDTREKAKKAVEKLKAWKRLKDKGFRFIPEGNHIEEGGDGENIILIACTMNDDKDFIYGDNKDLKLLFGDE